jgi:acetylornithine/succinyldiaminopimelate/putrescine aminotransferase
MSTDPDSRGGFGPFLPGVGPKFMDAESNERLIRFGVIEDLELALELYGTTTAGFLVEPIQGETGYNNYFTYVDRPPPPNSSFIQNCCTPSWIP